MPVKITIFMLFALTCLSASAVSIRTPVQMDAANSKVGSVRLSNESSTGSVGRSGFIGRLKHKFLSFFFNKPDTPTEKGSTKVVLGWLALGLILLGALIGRSMAPALILAGVVTGIVSLAIKKNKTEIEQKKKSNRPAIVALSLVVLGVIAIGVALSQW
jgi:hypothetical protein